MIDIVLPYVDSADSNWLADYHKFSNISGDKSAPRFRDADTLKYWFRSIETYCRFQHRIVLVVSNMTQVPSWVNTDKVLVVTHNQFIPSTELPTFNSSVITCYLPFIQELNNNYILFNDDMFILRPINDTMFYSGGRPLIHYSHIRFDENRGMWFKRINLCQDIISNWMHKPMYVVPEHSPLPHIKTLDLFIWKSLMPIFTKSLCNSRFRHCGNISDWVFPIAYYGLQLSQISQSPISTYFNTDDIRIPEYTSIACYNDTELIADFDKYKNALTSILYPLFNKQSTYEVYDETI